MTALRVPRRNPNSERRSKVNGNVSAGSRLSIGSESALEPHFSVEEVAARYRVCDRTVRNWVARRAMRAVIIGRLIRIPASALKEFDENQ